MLEEKTYTYDGNDNLVSMTDEEKQETVITYDLNNNPFFQSDIYGSPLFAADGQGTLTEDLKESLKQLL